MWYIISNNFFYRQSSGKIGCPFGIRVKEDGDKVVVYDSQSTHSHEADPKDRMRYWKFRKPSGEHGRTIRAMIAAKALKSKIYRYCQSELRVISLCNVKINRNKILLF